MSPERFDIVVIGAGAAGLHTALEAAASGASVCLISRKPLSESASFYAQGGLAAALADDDSPALHAKDTLEAGRGACRLSAVEVLANEAPLEVEKLLRRGVVFDLDTDGALALALEGGHQRRRIIHSGGSETGRAITLRLAELVADQQEIEVLERTSALALWSDRQRCAGVITEREPILAAATVLATGGGAALWSRTTNPRGAIAAGSELAHLAGAELADLELCQFHPTALALPGSEQDGELLTEALRGEGALLVDAAGERFTDELAPRDQVTGAIIEQMAADGAPHVGLDLRALDTDHFATVAETLRRADLDPTTEPVPIAPAAHYLVGGVACDLEGRSSLPGLYAVGEVACSGLHGANRLASNSLSECFVFGTRAARAALGEPQPDASIPIPGWRYEPPTLALRELIWEHAGPTREAEGLRVLLAEDYAVARLLGAAALEREETRGVHRRSDFPELDRSLDRTHLICEAEGRIRQERW